MGSLIGKSFYCLAGKILVSKYSSAGRISPQTCLLGYRKYWLRQHPEGEAQMCDTESQILPVRGKKRFHTLQCARNLHCSSEPCSCN